MDLLPDVGTWLLRSVRRTPNGSDNPISVVERLNSLPHPLRNADKDTLVGAVLSLGPSLQLALHMLMELLPEDESRGRLGEVLCPTLGHLQRSLEETLSYLEPTRLLADQLPGRSRTPVPRTETAQSKGERESSSVSDPASRNVQSASTTASTSSSRATSQDKKPSEARQAVQPTIIETPAPLRPSPPRIEDDITLTSTFPALQEPKVDSIDSPIPRTQPPPSSVSQYSDAPTHLQPSTTTQRPSTPNRQQSKSKSRSRSRSRSQYSNTDHPRRENPAADLALMKELRAEMRVNAAIQVAVDSLEFADGQMKIVRDVHRLHGSGSFELLQKHFYEGYNRILFRALELEQREFDSPSGSPVASPVRSGSRWQEDGSGGRQVDDGDEGYEGSGGLVSSPTKITVGSGSEGSGSPFRRHGQQIHGTPSGPHLQPVSQSTPAAPNVTPEHINTSYNHPQAPPPLILFNNHQTEPISLPPLPPLHSQSGVGGERPRPQTANPGQGTSGGMRTRWDDAALARNGRPLARRNTVQGQDVSGWSGAGSSNITTSNDRLDANTGGAAGLPTRPRGSLKRRLSLAEELALVDEDSDEEEEEEDDEGEDDQDCGVENKNAESSSDSEPDNQSKDSSSEEEDDDDDDDDDDESEDDDSASDTGEQQPAKPQPVVAKTVAPAHLPASAATATATATATTTTTTPRTVPRAPATAGTPGTSPVTVSDLEARRKSIGLQSAASRLPRPQSSMSMSRPGTPLGRPQTPLGRPQTSRVAGR